jgi:hypothetical protein
MQPGTSMTHSHGLKHLSLPKQETSTPTAPINNFAPEKHFFRNHFSFMQYSKSKN